MLLMERYANAPVLRCCTDVVLVVLMVLSGVIDELKNSEDRDRPRIRRQHQRISAMPLAESCRVGFIITPLGMACGKAIDTHRIFWRLTSHDPSCLYRILLHSGLVHGCVNRRL